MDFEPVIDALIARRKQMGYTQFRLAELADLAQPAVSRFESKKTIPQLDTLLKIIEALDCEVKIVPRK